MNYDKDSVRRRMHRAVSPREKIKNHILLRFFQLFLVLCLVVGVTLAGIGFGMFRGILAGTPDIDSVRVAPEGYFSTIYNADGEVTETLIGSNSNRIEASYDEFPADLVNAFVAIEDSRFWQHSGIDLRAIVRAVVGVVTENYSGGGSTITQQLIKNTVFNGGMETSSGSRLERKIQEQYLALQLTRHMDRETILTNYLNTINLGNNTLGVKSAALRYFDKDVSKLTLSECAVLAGITRNPSRYNPLSNPEENDERRRVILSQMLEQGYITREQKEEAVNDKVYDRVKTVNETVREADSTPFSYYTDELLSQVTEALKEKLGYNDTQAWNLLYSGGLKIYTPQDPKLQAIVDAEINNPDNYDAERFAVTYSLTVRRPDGTEETYNQENLRRFVRTQPNYGDFDGLFYNKTEALNKIDDFKNSLLSGAEGEGEGSSVVSESVSYTVEPQASFVLMEQSTGYVRAISGGRGEKTASRTLNRATGVTRQPGSTFKVISTFAPALDTCGATLATVYCDAPYSVPGKDFRNWWGNGYKGYHTIREGIIYSMNIIALRCMAETVTPQLGVEYAEKLGISTLESTDLNLATALGGLTRGVTNLDLTGAFAAIANSGTYTRPVFFTRILDHDGNILVDNQPETRQALKSSTAFLLTDAMMDSMQPNTLFATSGSGVSSTGTGAALEHMSCAGKSGTTTNNVDVWFVGFTPYYTAGVWGGCDANQSLKDSTGSRNGGTNYHKRLWKAIMTRVHEGLSDPGFAIPESIETAEVCLKSGKTPIAGVCSEDPRGNAVYTEYFARGTAPQESCDHHIRATVCGESGMTPTPDCPEEGLIQRTFLTVPSDIGENDDTNYLLPGACTFHGAQQESGEGTAVNVPEAYPAAPGRSSSPEGPEASSGPEGDGAGGSAYRPSSADNIIIVPQP